jgi:hypothetical protein
VPGIDRVVRTPRRETFVVTPLPPTLNDAPDLLRLSASPLQRRTRLWKRNGMVLPRFIGAARRSFTRVFAMRLGAPLRWQLDRFDARRVPSLPHWYDAAL